jgi:hypothetical protein
MSFLRKLFGIPNPIDVMRYDIFMEYNALTGTGSAALEWIPLASNDPNLQPILVVLLYARILGAHKETRAKLFWTIDELSKQNVRNNGQIGFPFPDWTLHVGARVPPQRIWPWELYDSPSSLIKPKVYKATLKAFQGLKAPGYFGIHLKMALGQERILAPASALIAITSYTQSTDQEGCYELAVLLWKINEFYGSPDRVRVGREHEALSAATAAIRSGNLRAP